jgi:6,7-dimethyl-8-ribityllumazine synthase
MSKNSPKNFSLNKKKFPHLKIGIVCAEWNEEITEKMLQQCISVLEKHEVKKIELIKVPGSFEIPYAVLQLCKGKKMDAIIALGCIIKGETIHDEVLAYSVTDALMQLTLEHEKPIVLGVLTTNNFQQALERINGTQGNKGKECAETALRMCEIIK